MPNNNSHSDVRDAIARLCADFPGEYWRDKDRDKAYPTEFVEALTEGGYLSVLIPEEYGGMGQGFLAGAIAAEELAKVDLAFEISRVIEERGLTQVQAAEIMGVDQPKVSALVRYRLDGFSTERLYRFLNALGRDVEIIVRPKPKSHERGTLRVTRKVERS